MQRLAARMLRRVSRLSPRRLRVAPALAALSFSLSLVACATTDAFSSLPPTAAGPSTVGATLAPAALPASTPWNTPVGASDVAAAEAAVAVASAPEGAAPAPGGASSAAPGTAVAVAAPAQETATLAPDDDKPAPAALTPYDPLQPEAPVDLADRNAHADLWARVRAGFALPDIDTPDVKEWEQWYAARPDYVARMTSRGSRYLFHITEELEKRHMPTELALLPFTESAFNPQAMSVAKASGMWQFISSTGRDYDLKQNIFRDDRRDVLASTQAALDYLQRLHDMFGDWQLALAAYNCGEGSVQRAIDRNRRAGRPVDYLSLNLPAETRGYVPKLQAVKNIVTRPQAYGLSLPPLENHPYFLSVPIERDIDVDLAAQLAGISRDEFRMLNPQFNKPVILAAGTPQVLLPYDNADDFVRELDAHPGPLASWTAWVAAKTLRPAEAAKIVGMSEAELRDVNHIPPRMLVKAGSTLLVPRSAQHVKDVSEQVADGAAMMLAPDLPPTRRVSVHVGRGGETVASVARRWHVGAAQVASWNHVSASGRFRAGATAVVFVPRAAATELARAGTSRAPLGKAAGRTQLARTTPHGSALHGKSTPHGPAARVAQASHGASHAAAKKPSHGSAGVHVAKSVGTAKPGGTSSTRSSKTRARVAER
jgi:membrane-bound lytic murein transglycosylase D